MICASLQLALLSSALLAVIGTDVVAQKAPIIAIRHAGEFITWDDVSMDRALLTRLDLDARHRNLSGVIVVDQSGKGDSTTVQGAVDLVPDGNPSRVKILVLPGIYREKVKVPSSKPYVSLLGKEKEGSNTIITWNAKASDKKSDGSELGTSCTATVSIFSDYFCASEITFQNTVVAMPGEKGKQAVALRVAAQRAMFYKVSILGSQDTLLDDSGSHFFYHCFIQGSVDFIFGNARSLYQNSVLHSVANQSGAIAAHHRNTTEENTGFSFLYCTITGSGMIYLGRAWGDYPRIVYSYCNIQDIITPERWSDWNIPTRRLTSVFGEFRCRGRGSYSRRRETWTKSFSYREARPYLGRRFIDGDKWLRL